MLHGPFGIGVMGREAMEFIDFLHGAGFHVWQVLPVEHTGEGFAPYCCVSAYAGEPMLIDPRMLLEMGLITQDELEERAEGISADAVEYEIVHEKQWELLRKAYSRLNKKPFSRFKPFWLDNYALYMALKHHFGDEPWYKWPDDLLRSRDRAAISKAKKEFARDIDFHKFVQWLFHEQWRKLKEYAIGRGVSIVGDLPFYVSKDSAEVWGRRDLFDCDPDGNVAAVSGAPPDYFTPDGQLWGNPIYNWKLMKQEGYVWWIDRIKASSERYDLVRLDHFRGFESYWRIPYGAPSAVSGKWVKGPGATLFKTLEKALGKLPVIAEDLGDIGDGVEKLLKATKIRSIRVLQIGFLGDERHMPHNLSEDNIAYTGTHDSTTMLAWLFELSPADREKALFYLGFNGDWTKGGPNCAINEAWMRAIFMTASSIAIVPIQDMLGYGADTRTNIPGTTQGNWRFRIKPEALKEIDTEFYTRLIEITERNSPLSGELQS
jgi:4-alpha-glucanotransferase